MSIEVVLCQGPQASRLPIIEACHLRNTVGETPAVPGKSTPKLAVSVLCPLLHFAYSTPFNAFLSHH